MQEKSRKAKKIFLISNTSWYIYNFRRKLMLELQLRGYEVVVVAPRDMYSLHFKNYIVLPMDNKGVNPAKDILMVVRLIKIFIKHRPDVILSYTPKCNIYAALASGFVGLPIINNISGLGTAFIRDNWVTLVVRWLYTVSMRYSRKVFFQNHDDLNLFVKMGLVKPALVERLPGSGVDIDRFTPLSIEKMDKRFVFLFVARVLKDKGIIELIEAVRLLKPRYPEMECQILGFLDAKNASAISNDEMQAWVDEGVVNYLGSSDDVVDYLRHADCVVLPSYREGTPRSLLEAASVGKPVITTDAVGCREVVEDGVNGFLCAVKDVIDLQDKMEKMLLLPEQQRLAMGIKGREKMMREFDEQIVIDKYLQLIGEILENKEQRLRGSEPLALK